MLPNWHRTCCHWRWTGGLSGSFGKAGGGIAWIAVAEIGQVALQQQQDQQTRLGYEGSSRVCQGYGKDQKFVGYRERALETQLGCLKIKRAYYHCLGCGNGCMPYELGGGFGAAGGERESGQGGGGTRGGDALPQSQGHVGGSPWDASCPTTRFGGSRGMWAMPPMRWNRRRHGGFRRTARPWRRRRWDGCIWRPMG